MPFDSAYHDEVPSRADLEQLSGPVLVEFGTVWCPICRGFDPDLKALLDEFPQVQHVRVADGRGKPLGRSFAVKLWPTFVGMSNGTVVDKLVRPSRDEVRKTLEAIVSDKSTG